ncbi:MAG: hypothetical protein IJT87_01875 [Ruminiclostridium sp.]|nr:hypothetical protein [Ruminiclostridium sp.]
MIAVTIDKLCAKHPAFEKYVFERIDAFYGTSTGTNAAIFIIAGLTAGMLCGAYIPDIPRYFSLGAMVAAWVFTSMLAGFLRQWLFIMVPALYLMLPHLLYIIPGSSAAEQASDLQILLSDLSEGVLLQPIRPFAGDNDLYIVSIVMFVCCLAVFLLGLRFRSRAKRSNTYCKRRLEQLRDEE